MIIMSPTALNAAAIAQAHRTIDPVFLNTPQFELGALNDRLNARLVLKVETLNPIRSFKGRGTNYFVQQNPGASAFVCASAGNFGQGLAYACQQRGIALTVFAAEGANALKVRRMEQLGAVVKLAGADFDAAKSYAQTYAAEHGIPFVEDGRDIAITVGAGTIGWELSQYPDPIDTLLVPVGNGALINGIATWFKEKSPDTTVIGVVAAGAPAMDLSWRQNRMIATESVNTIADGIGVRVPVPTAVETMQTLVDDMVQVPDSTILTAMQWLHEYAGLVIEPAGAVGLAALLANPTRFAEQVVATPLCGSNLTAKQLAEWL